MVWEKHLLVITNEDYITQLLKTLHMWYVLVLKCQQDIIYPYAMAEWEKTLYISHIQKHFPEAKVEQIQELEYIR